MASSTSTSTTGSAILAGVAAGATGFGLYMAWKTATSGDVVTTAPGGREGHKIYETDESTNQYLVFHFQDQIKGYCPYDKSPTGLGFAKK